MIGKYELLVGMIKEIILCQHGLELIQGVR